jgi:hypothetical protein
MLQIEREIFFACSEGKLQIFKSVAKIATVFLTFTRDQILVLKNS